MKYTIVCKVCQKVTERSAPNALFCSEECYRKNKTIEDARKKALIIRKRICEWCKQEFIIVGRQQRYCCKEHQALIKHRRSKEWSKSQVHPCKNCGKEISGFGYQYWSLECGTQYRKQKHREGIDWNRKVLTASMRHVIIEEHGNKCSKCGWHEVNQFTGLVPLEIEHIDGNSENNKKENLTVLCPSCHSLTATYKGANKGNGRHMRRQRYQDGKSY